MSSLDKLIDPVCVVASSSVVDIRCCAISCSPLTFSQLQTGDLAALLHISSVSVGTLKIFVPAKRGEVTVFMETTDKIYAGQEGEERTSIPVVVQGRRKEDQP